MQEYMSIYKNNSSEIQNFLIETIFNIGNIKDIKDDRYKKLFKIFPSLELVYICNEDMVQTSQNIYKNRSSKIPIGRDRKYLREKINFESNNISMSKPYLSSATGQTCITVAKKEDSSIFFLDFNVDILIQRLGLIDVHNGFNTINKSFYFLTSLIMILLSVFTVGYSIYEFINSTLIKGVFSIESAFKPVIALTLGLAIFDLAKTVLAQEVLFKSYSKSSHAEYKVLTKFSITIIIALLIESLMVVFKIALDDYAQMIHAFYLIGGVSILVVSLSVFIFFTKKTINKPNKESLSIN